MNLIQKVPLTLLLVLAVSIANAQTSTPSFFSSNMVLQQDEEVAIWGNDDPKTSIEVSGSWGKSVTGKLIKMENGK